MRMRTIAEPGLATASMRTGTVRRSVGLRSAPTLIVSELTTEGEKATEYNDGTTPRMSTGPEASFSHPAGNRANKRKTMVRKGRTDRLNEFDKKAKNCSSGAIQTSRDVKEDYCDSNALIIRKNGVKFKKVLRIPWTTAAEKMTR
jgi:hypothetical protein